MAPAGEERGTVAEPDAEQLDGGPDPAAAERAEHPASFDPGTETGYLRRGARSHELDPEVGAAPFDPGPQHYDGRRAKRRERRKEKAERKRREKAELRERKREEAARAEREERARATRERLAAERSSRVAAAAADRDRGRQAELERGHAEQERLAALEEAERRKQEREERRRAEREQRERAETERRAEKERARAERDAAEDEQRLERRRERRRREERERAELKLAERRRREREWKRSGGKPKGRPAAKPAPVAAAPAVAEAHQRRAAAKRAATGLPPKRPPKATPRRGPQAKTTSLRRPTAKVGIALAAVVAVAVGVGVLMGLPLPLVGNSDGPDASLADTPPLTLDPGTPTGLTKGPYHPVVISNPDYGEAAARFGADRGGRRHEGQDVFASPGTPLVAVRDGIVVDGGGGKSFYSYGGGNTLAIYSPLDDRSYIYLHMLKPALVRAGEHVKAGQLVGQVGCTGSCDGPHLHFEVRVGRAVYGPQKKALDPLPLLRQWPVRPVENGK